MTSGWGARRRPAHTRVRPRLLPLARFAGNPRATATSAWREATEARLLRFERALVAHLVVGGHVGVEGDAEGVGGGGCGLRRADEEWLAACVRLWHRYQLIRC